jgi:hypothetical protein
MNTITRIGLELAKSVFQLHGVDSAGQAVKNPAASGGAA